MKIVFVTCGFAPVSPTRGPIYGAANAGLHAFGEALRRQLALYGAHGPEVQLFLIDTPMTAHVAGRGRMAPA